MIRAVIWDCYGVLYQERGAQLVRSDDVLAYVESLRPAYKIGLLSNLGPGAIDRFFTGDEQKSLFDTVVVSSAVGMSKPDPDIFLYACSKLGVEPSEAVMIDDIESNCDGARAAGLQAIWFKSLSQTQAALREIIAE